MSKITTKCELIGSLTEAALAISQPDEEIAINQTLGENDIESYLSSNILDNTTSIVLNINGGIPHGTASDGRYVNETDNITCWITRKGDEPTDFPTLLLDIREEMLEAIESNVIKFEQLNGISVGGWTAKKYSGQTWVIEFEFY